MHGRRVVSVLGTAALIVTGLAAPAYAASLAARASVVSPVEYVGHAAGVARTVSVTNTGIDVITSITVTRPSSVWVVTACTNAAGFVATRSVTGCRWTRSSGGLAAGRAITIGFSAGTTPQAHDQGGTWSVSVGGRSGTARAANAGLAAHAYSLQITRVAVDRSGYGKPLYGSACPAPARTARYGDTFNVVVCAKDWSTADFVLSPRTSALKGSFLMGPGTWNTGTGYLKAGKDAVAGVAYEATSVVAVGGSWTVQTSLRNGSLTQTSPLWTAGPFRTIDHDPTAEPVASATTTQGTPVFITLTGKDVDGESLRFAIQNQPAHGVMSNPSEPSCAGADPSTCTSVVQYTPVPDFVGTDHFTYTIDDGFGGKTAVVGSVTVQASGT